MTAIEIYSTLESMNPAEFVINLFGGVRPTARALECDPGTVQRWRRPKARKGTGGLIPSCHHQPLIDAAKAQGKRLTANHLIHGDSR